METVTWRYTIKEITEIDNVKLKLPMTRQLYFLCQLVRVGRLFWNWPPRLFVYFPLSPFFCLRFASCGHQTSTTNINVFPPVPKWRPSRSRWLPEFDWLLVFQQKPASLEPIFTSAAGAKERSGNYLASFVFQERERGASSESGRVPVACLSTRAPSDESGPLWNDPVSVRVRLVPTVRFFHRLVIWPLFSSCDDHLFGDSFLQTFSPLPFWKQNFLSKNSLNNLSCTI